MAATSAAAAPAQSTLASVPIRSSRVILSAPPGRRRPRHQGWPATAPGTPVFVEYFGWIFVSGRMWWMAWETAIAASA